MNYQATAERLLLFCIPLFFKKAARIPTKSSSHILYTGLTGKKNGLGLLQVKRVHYIIYVDRVWLMDFVISTYLLLLVRKTYGLKSSTVRLIVSAAAGASVFVLLLLLPGIGLVFKLFLQAVCVELLLLKAAFSLRTKEMVVRLYVCMNGYGLLSGGMICFMAGYLPGMRGELSMWKVLFASTVTAGLVSLYLHFRRRGRTQFYTVKLDFYGETLVCRGFADSGNSLYEPYGRRPVSILTAEEAAPFLERVPPEKHFLVPFHSIGKKHGLLHAVELPGMEVEDGEERRAFRKVVVALSEEAVTEKGNYQIILHPKFVRQEE